MQTPFCLAAGRRFLLRDFYGCYASNDYAGYIKIIAFERPCRPHIIALIRTQIGRVKSSQEMKRECQMKIAVKKLALAGFVAALALGAFAAPANAYWARGGYGYGRGGGYWSHGYWRAYPVGYYGPGYYPPPPVIVTPPPGAYYAPAPAYYGPAPVGVSLGVHIR
jgi:hypothetical protein